MIILKATNETLRVTTSPGLHAPVRKGYVHAVGSGSSIVLVPEETIAIKDWMIIVVAAYDGATITAPPTGWTVLQVPTLAGTQYTAIYGKLRGPSDGSYTVPLSAGATGSSGTLLWGSGSDAVANWTIGATMPRASITPATTTDSVAPSITTTDDHTLVLAISTERTTADEADVVNMQGAEKWAYIGQTGTSALQSTVIGVMRDVSPAAATGDVTISYVNPHASSAQAVQIGIPRTRAVLIDSSVSYAESGVAGMTHSSLETQVQDLTNTTVFGAEVPTAQNQIDDTIQVELGMAFTTTSAVTVKSIRYYKGVGSSGGLKVGALWTSTGTLLASVTFTNETTSGWQEQALDSPIILAGAADYVVSYNAPQGNYANTPRYFEGTKVVGPITVLSTLNGRYGYGPAGTFPTNSYMNTNYFVDLVFTTSLATHDTTIISSPDTGMTRTVKLLSLVNRASNSSMISVAKSAGNVTYVLTPTVQLGAGEMLQYVAGVGWKLHATDGTIKADFAVPATAGSQVMLNMSGRLQGDARLSWLPQRDTLAVTGSNAQLLLSLVSTIPTIAPTNNLKLFGQKIAGKSQLVKKGPTGDIEAMQAAMWQNNIALWTPALNVGTWLGMTGNTIGSATQVAPTATTIYSGMRRSVFATAAAASSQAGIRSDATFFRSVSPVMGGFFYSARFGFSSIKSGNRAFIGMSSSTVIVTNEPSSMTNMCGFGFDSTDNEWVFMHNDASGAATKDSIAGQGSLAVNDSCYDAYIWNPPNSNSVYYRLDRVDTGVTVVEGSTDTNIPVTNVQLMAVIHTGNGTANLVAGDAAIGVNRMYIETNR